MITFQVADMTCGHCVSTITKAVKAVDVNAQVSVDLQRALVTIDSKVSDASDLSDAITEAGYTPVPAQAKGASKRAGSCCGCCH